MEMTLVKYST